MIKTESPLSTEIAVHCAPSNDERPEGADEIDLGRKVVIEIRDARRMPDLRATSFGKALLTFAIDALIFLCVTHLAARGVLPSILAGGLIGSLVGARIYAARSQALGVGASVFAGSTFGALVLGVAGLLSLRAFRT